MWSEGGWEYHLLSLGWASGEKAENKTRSGGGGETQILTDGT